MDADSNQEKAIDLVEWLEWKIHIPYIIFAETVSVLTAKFSRERANDFVEYIKSDSRYIIVNNDISSELSFWESVNSRLSYMDIASVYMTFQYDLELITFDKSMMQLYKQFKFEKELEESVERASKKDISGFINI
jgi:predicted nucleic-acid-binding protein